MSWSVPDVPCLICHGVSLMSPVYLVMSPLLTPKPQYLQSWWYSITSPHSIILAIALLFFLLGTAEVNATCEEKEWQVPSSQESLEPGIFTPGILRHFAQDLGNSWGNWGLQIIWPLLCIDSDSQFSQSFLLYWGLDILSWLAEYIAYMMSYGWFSVVNVSIR